MNIKQLSKELTYIMFDIRSDKKAMQVILNKRSKFKRLIRLPKYFIKMWGLMPGVKPLSRILAIYAMVKVLMK